MSPDIHATENKTVMKPAATPDYGLGGNLADIPLHHSFLATTRWFVPAQAGPPQKASSCFHPHNHAHFFPRSFLLAMATAPHSSPTLP